LALADLIVTHLLPAGSPLTVAVDDTLFKRSGRKVFGVAWYHDGAAKGLPTALGHIAVRRRHTVRFLRADQMFRTLKAARLDNSVEAEMRALARIELLILDDFALQSMDSTETSDFYELIVERHQRPARS
jgi:hypothetical protein